MAPIPDGPEHAVGPARNSGTNGESPANLHKGKAMSMHLQHEIETIKNRLRSLVVT
jgi:hypothetical protein